MLRKTIQGESTLKQRPWAEERHGGEWGSERGWLDWCELGRAFFLSEPQLPCL